jgi:hypothetical protein
MRCEWIQVENKTQLLELPEIVKKAIRATEVGHPAYVQEGSKWAESKYNNGLWVRYN